MRWWRDESFWEKLLLLLRKSQTASLRLSLSVFLSSLNLTLRNSCVCACVCRSLEANKSTQMSRTVVAHFTSIMCTRRKFSPLLFSLALCYSRLLLCHVPCDMEVWVLGEWNVCIQQRCCLVPLGNVGCRTMDISHDKRQPFYMGCMEHLTLINYV